MTGYKQQGVTERIVVLLISFALVWSGNPMTAIAQTVSDVRVMASDEGDQGQDHEKDQEKERLAAEFVRTLREKDGLETAAMVRLAYRMCVAAFSARLSSTDAEVSNDSLAEMTGEVKDSANAAHAFALIMEAMDLDCLEVQSKGGTATWNMVRFDDAWYHVDVWAAAMQLQVTDDAGTSIADVERSDKPQVSSRSTSGAAASLSWLCVSDARVRELDASRTEWQRVDGTGAPKAEKDFAWEVPAETCSREGVEGNPDAQSEELADEKTEPKPAEAPAEAPAEELEQGTSPNVDGSGNEPTTAPSEDGGEASNKPKIEPEHRDDDARQAIPVTMPGEKPDARFSVPDELQPTVEERATNSAQDPHNLLNVQTVDVSRYSYEVRPLLEPFNNYVYVKTDNPDPYSFILKDKQSHYMEAGQSEEVYYGTYYVAPMQFADVLYENASTYRVKGGYIFYDAWGFGRCDGGTLYVQAYAGFETYVDTGKTVSCPPLKTYVDYLVEDCTGDATDFFDKLDNVQEYLYSHAVYPTRVFDTSKPTNVPYPMLVSSPYPEHTLMESLSMYQPNSDSLLSMWLYPFVLDSQGMPGTMDAVARRLDPSCTIGNGSVHWLTSITKDGVTKTYGGAGDGGSDPLYDSAVNKDYRFDFIAGDATKDGIDALRERLLAYKAVASDQADTYNAMLYPAAVARVVGNGSWIRVCVAGKMSDVHAFGYAVGVGEGSAYYASDAWIDGRYIGIHEVFEPQATFDQHPTSNIYLTDVSINNYDGSQGTATVCYVYQANTDTWEVESQYAHRLNNGATSLTRDQVLAMGVDRNRNVPIDSCRCFDGTSAPGTPIGTVRLRSIGMQRPSMVMSRGASEWLNLSYTPSDADFRDVSYTSSNSNVVSVSPYGDLLAEGVGTAIITATSFDGGHSCSCKVTVMERMPNFPDVDYYDWYYDVVNCAVAYGLMNGYGNGYFGPADKITRGQVAVVLWNMAGCPDAGAGAKTFSDVKGTDYFYRAVRWASSAGVVSGYGNGKFGPKDNVTREQLAVMLANYAKNVRGQAVEGSATDFGSMKDKNKVSSWAVPSVGWCFHNGILSGSGGNVNPAGNAARAEAAKMVVGLYDLVG